MNLDEIIMNMTLEEKASLCSGKDSWRTKPIPRLNIPQMMVSDGPHGLRKQKSEAVDMNETIEAVCFPAGCATAASFDRDLLYKLGETLGNECQAEGVGVILGPAVNIKRSPLCGRNFEYYSEDPYLASEIAASQIKGIQSKNVGTSIKHFFANNQEHRRMSSSSEMDERTAREIYLSAFEGAIKQSKPWTVMCSYNRINGIYAAQNKKYLTDILRDEWGFDGFVVSDWGATNDRVLDLEAGMDLEMPSSFGLNDKKIVEAVKNGTLAEDILDKAVKRILNIVFRFENNRDKNAVFNKETDHELARKICAESIVLLKNENILPLSNQQKVAFIGEFAKNPRYQGSGSSHINSFKVESAMDCIDSENIIYSQGYNGKDDIVDNKLLTEAVDIAKKVDTVVIFAGLPDKFESEGYDRTHMQLPQCQNTLIKSITEVNKNVVVVLHNGSPVEMPWVDDVKAIVEVYLGGQAVGGATVDILYGKVNPSGHLAESFPIKLQDNPSYLYYLGEGDKTEYREGVFVGYRYYDKKDMNVLFPFGHGLSYTTFEYSNICVDKNEMYDTDTLEVKVDICNTGKYQGKEVVQLYVEPQKGDIIRPVRELKGFEKIDLKPNEKKTVTFKLDKRSFAYFNTDINNWSVETGKYSIAIGQSSRNIKLRALVSVKSTDIIKKKFTLDTTVGDALKIKGADELIKPFIDKSFADKEIINNSLGEGMGEMMKAMLNYAPIRSLITFGEGSLTFEDAYKLVDKLNQL